MRDLQLNAMKAEDDNEQLPLNKKRPGNLELEA